VATELVELSLTATASDPNDDPLTFSLGGAPAGASIDSNTGVFTWTPTEEQGPGVYSVTIIVSDGGMQDQTSFDIIVEEANAAPVAEDDDSVTTDEDVSVDITLSASDNDIPPQTLNYFIVTLPINGILSATSGNPVTYTPNPNYNGADSFTFKTNDGVADSNEATIDITVNPVNDAPEITLNGSNPFNLVVGDTFTDPGATASDIEDGDLTASIVVTGSIATTSLPGTFTIVYSVTDSGSLSASTTRDVVITLQPVENNLTLCSDGIDNDEDQLIDLLDPDCAAFKPTLTVNKIVNGGDKQVSDFPLFIGTTSVISGVTTTLDATGTYIVSETNNRSNYTSAISGACDPNGNVTLNVGDVKDCTITNTYVAPQSPAPPSGGSGGGARILIIFNEANGDVLTTTAIVMWFTSLPATTRVVYNTVPHNYDFGTSPNYGYTYSTLEDSNKITFHAVTITGLTPNTTYYWRAISHGSGEVWGQELVFTTAVLSQSQPPGVEIVAGEEAFVYEGTEPGPAGAGEAVPGEMVEGAVSEETAVGQEESGTGLGKFLAAIGSFFGSGNLCWLLLLLIAILLVLFLLSVAGKKQEKKKQWILPLIILILIILYSFLSCANYLWLIIIISLSAISFLILRKKATPME